MNNNTKITNICARHIFDSRGVPTITCTVTLSDGSMGQASVPSGASTGKYEAHELRDNTAAYHGKGVFNAIYNINRDISKAICGMDGKNQFLIDRTMIELDGSKNKSNLGANAILAVSLAVSHACANSYNMPLFRYIGGTRANTLPLPMMNILNGGAHADNNLDIQEFMIIPRSANSMVEAMNHANEIYHTLKLILREEGLLTAVGDEGGFAPNLRDDREALDLIIEAIEKSGFHPGHDITLAIDVAASEWYHKGEYILPKRQKRMTSDQLIEYISTLTREYPIVSVEDPLADEDLAGFEKITRELSHIQIVGDDLFVTNPERIKEGIEKKCANAVLVKPNQIGTLTETLDAIALAQNNGYGAIISHRSGETTDTTIADLAVAVNAGQIKTGAPARGERTCKYNRLLEIEDMMDKWGRFGNK